MLVLKDLKNSYDSNKNHILRNALVALFLATSQISESLASDIVISGDSSDDIFATQVDQKIIYNSGNFTGRIISAVDEEFAGHLIVNSDLNYSARLMTLDMVEVSKDVNLTLSRGGSNVHEVILHQGSSLNIGSSGGFDFKDMDGAVADTGTLNVSGTYSLFRGAYGRPNEHIGRTNRLAEINVFRGGSFWAYGQVNAAQINLDGLVVLGKPGDFDELRLGRYGTLMLLPGSINEANRGAKESSYDDNYNVINGNILATNDPVTQSNNSSIYFSALWLKIIRKPLKSMAQLVKKMKKLIEST